MKRQSTHKCALRLQLTNTCHLNIKHPIECLPVSNAAASPVGSVHVPGTLRCVQHEDSAKQNV
jgi:hypothetical protein